LALAAFALWMGNRLPFHNDTLVYDYPERAYNLQSFRAGLIPLWNPYLSCGIPHLANWQSSFFYPPYWLLGFLGLCPGLAWLALLHGAWAFTGFYFWSRSQKCGGWVASLAAFSFAGSAHFIRCWVNLHFIATASWIPWVFLSVHQAVQTRRLKDLLLAVSCVSLQLLAGYPSFVLYTWIILFLWLLLVQPLKSTLGWMAAILAPALLLTSFQWLPFLEFLTFASHDHWASFPYFLHPQEYLTLFHPTLLGVPGSTDYRGDSTNSIYGDLYFGLVPCGIWIFSLLFKRNRAGLWGPLSLFLLVWMAGPALWKFIPPDAFNFLEPSKAVGLFLFAACTSLGRFLADGGKFPGWKKGWAPWAWVFAALWVADLLVLPYRLTYPVPDPYKAPVLQQEAKDLREKAHGRILALQTSAQMSVQGEKIDDRMQESLSRIFPDNFLPNTSMVWPLSTVSGYFSLQTENLRNIMRYLNRGLPYRGDLLQVAGVRAFLLPQPLPSPKYRSAGKIGENFLSLDPAASEDMRWAPDAVEYPDRPSILNILARPGSQWRKVVYLERNSQGSLTRLPIVSRQLDFSPVEAFQRPSAGRASAFASQPQPGYWIFNDSYAPGWHAWVDSEPAPILRAYGLFMAVAVEAGSHQVDFRYEPATFRLGLFLALLALVLCLGMLFL
jgi:hypothetical protein